ncbi:MAG: flippase [Elusimicrobia bacterium]|nr:flippase [Elusimicrobiota bacterium]
MTALARVARNAGWLLVNNGFARLVGLLTSVLLARTLGVVDFGTLATVLSYANTMIGFSDLGITAYTIREVAAQPERAEKWFPAGLLLMGLLLLLAFTAALGGGWSLGARDSLVLVVLVCLGMALSRMGSLIGAYTQGMEHMEVLAISEGAYRFALLACVSIALALGWRLQGVGWSYLIAGLVFLCVGFRMAVPRLLKPVRSVDWALIPRMIQGAVPYACSGYLAMIYMNVGVLFCAHWAGSAQAGYFGSALGLMVAARTLPGLALQAAFPTMTRQVAEDASNIEEWNSRAQRLILILLLPVSVVGIVFSREIVLLVYGKSYMDAAPVVAVLLAICVFAGLVNASGYVFTSVNRIFVAVKISALALVLQCGLSYLWTPRWGALGAAWALGIADVFTWLSCMVSLRFMLNLRFPIKAVARGLAAALLMGAAAWFLKPHLFWVGAILAALCVYGAALVAAGVLSDEDRRIFGRMVREVSGGSRDASRASRSASG